jgi:dolichol kinase
MTGRWRRDPQERLREAMERAKLPHIDVPPRVRFEMRRKTLHILTAIVAVPMLLLLPFYVALGLAVTGIVVISLTWAIERKRIPQEFKGPLHDEFAQVLQKTQRPGEDFPWSPVLYTASLIVIGVAHEFLGLSWAIAFAAYAILGIGDAASALVGVAYGRHKLAWNRKKSAEGTLAGFLAGLLGGLVMGSVPYAFAGLVVPPLIIPVVLVGAAAGALAETIPRVEDNFVVPLAAAAAMWGAALVFGVPLP